MFTLPLYYFLFAYFAFLVFFAALVTVNFTHLVHTGTLTFASFIVTLFFFALSAIIIWATWYALQGINWQQSVLSIGATFGSTFNLPGNGGI